MNPSLEKFILTWWAPIIVMMLLAEMCGSLYYRQQTCKEMQELRQDLEYLKGRAICSIEAEWEDNSQWIEIT